MDPYRKDEYDLRDTQGSFKDPSGPRHTRFDLCARIQEVDQDQSYSKSEADQSYSMSESASIESWRTDSRTEEY